LSAFSKKLLGTSFTKTAGGDTLVAVDALAEDANGVTNAERAFADLPPVTEGQPVLVSSHSGVKVEAPAYGSAEGLSDDVDIAAGFPTENPSMTADRLGVAESGISANCSFAAETRVLMADGTTKSINEVTAGDEVLAQDPETGKTSMGKVTDLWVHTDDLAQLEIDGATVETTANHPFWNETDNKWERADELDRGDYVRTSDGRHLKVLSFKAQNRRGLAYNLTVEGLHTYHVLFGPYAVLVHNACRVSPLGAKDVGTKGVHLNMSDGTEIALRPGADGIVLKPLFVDKMSAIGQAEAEAALANPTFRAKLLGQLRTAFPGMANSPDALVRKRSIEVHRLIKWLEKSG
jgi:Pretoxin HINT domain